MRNKTVLLGVTGGVAAYKAIELTRRLREKGASVIPLMTEAATHFVTPLSLETAASHRVITSLFEEPMAHIHLPAKADVMVVAPATANIIGKFAGGIADDFLSTSFLSFRGPVVLAPAMNWRMYEHPAVRKNLSLLEADGVVQVGPERGELACGEEGMGRMAEVKEIIEAVSRSLCTEDMAGKRVVVTAGPTREYLDPVRFISNRSSGKMGYALAGAARNRGAEVTLITGPSPLPRPSDMKISETETSAEMLAAVMGALESKPDLLIMAAAVADFTPETRQERKMEKTGKTILSLRPTADIVSTAAGNPQRPFIIGFAAETGDNVGRAAAKMREKGMDMIVFNNVLEPGAGFDTDTNRVVIIMRSGRRKSLPIMTKDAVAHVVLDAFVGLKA